MTKTNVVSPFSFEINRRDIVSGLFSLVEPREKMLFAVRKTFSRVIEGTL